MRLTLAVAVSTIIVVDTATALTTGGSDMTLAPIIGQMTKRSGVAGEIVVTAEVKYPGEPLVTVRFHGSAYGSPVVLDHPSIGQMFVTDPTRFGVFGDNPYRWVRAFYAAS